MKHDLKEAVVCVVGLGYVGLPLAQAFARSLKVSGFDTNIELIRGLNLCSNSQNLAVTDNHQ